MLGIDKQIENAKIYLQEIFPDMKIYGRVYRNYRDDSIIPEVFEGGSYLETLTDDTYKDGVLFFDVEPKREVKGGAVTADVNIVVISKLGIDYDTEKVHADVSKVLQRCDFEITGLTTGLEALEPFTAHAPDDMYPYHIFKIISQTKYNLFCN